MTHLSAGAVAGGLLVGGVLLFASAQTVVTQLARSSEPAASVALQQTSAAQDSAPSIVRAGFDARVPYAKAGTMLLAGAQLAGAGQSLQATDIANLPSLKLTTLPNVICFSCTTTPAASATLIAGGTSPTQVGQTATPQYALPTRTRTPRATPWVTPVRRVPTATATALGPTTSTTPTQPPATPTNTATLTSSTTPAAPTSPLPGTATAPVALTPTSIGGSLPVRTTTPVPLPPVPPATFQLWVSSDFDPTGGIYRSAGDTISWPAGEVLNFTPAVSLVTPSSPDPGVIYRSRLLAWSFVSSGGQSAPSMDVMGHSGCRLRAVPAPRDAAGLAGCAYRYLERPTVEAMRMQAHAFWSAGTPLDMCVDVHTYDLGQLRDTDLLLQAAIRTEAVDASTGRVLASATAIRSATFALHLTVPRSAY